jgi:hypothetical protein
MFHNVFKILFYSAMAVVVGLPVGLGAFVALALIGY